MRVGQLVDRLFQNLSFRKVYHFLGGGLILFAVATLDLRWIFVSGLLYLAAFWIWGKRISFAVLGILILLALTRSRFATLGAGIIFVIGDGLAAVVGSAYGRTKWCWNRDKSLAGSAAFLLSSLSAEFVFLRLAGPYPPGFTAAAMVLPCLTTCVLESLPIAVIRDRKPDDNLIIILGAGGILHALTVLFSVQARV